MTPDQIETMRKIARADFIAQDDYEPGSAPEWAIEGFRPVIREGRWAIRLTEAGAEVLRLWEEREAAAKEIPRHVRLTLATVQRAFERDDYRDLGTICEDVQSVADAAMMRVRAVKGERDALRDALNEAEHALTAERAAHAETLLVLAAAPLVADAAVIGGPEVSAKTVAATVHDGLRRLHEDLQTERRRNVAIEEEGGAESILSDLGALLDERVGWFEGEGTVEHVRRALDERDSLRAAHAETLLVLAAEQGRQEGAPPGWGRTSWLWQRCIGGPPITTLEVTQASTHPEDKPWHWRIFRPALIAEGYAATARAAMLAADSFSPPSGGRSERDSG